MRIFQHSSMCLSVVARLCLSIFIAHILFPCVIYVDNAGIKHFTVLQREAR